MQVGVTGSSPVAGPTPLEKTGIHADPVPTESAVVMIQSGRITRQVDRRRGGHRAALFASARRRHRAPIALRRSRPLRREPAASASIGPMRTPRRRRRERRPRSAVRVSGTSARWQHNCTDRWAARSCRHSIPQFRSQFVQLLGCRERDWKSCISRLSTGRTRTADLDLASQPMFR